MPGPLTENPEFFGYLGGLVTVAFLLVLILIFVYEWESQRHKGKG